MPKQILFLKCAAIFVLVIVVSSSANVTTKSAQSSSKINNSHPQAKKLEGARITLAKCDTKNASAIKAKFIEIPTQSPTEGEETWEYHSVQYKISEGNPMRTCKYNGHLSEPIETISLEAYPLWLNEVDNVPIRVQRLQNVLLGSGHLAIGENLHASDYYDSDEFCLDSMSGHGESTVFGFRYCKPSEERPIVIKCCPVGAILSKEGRCIGSSSWNDWHFPVLKDNSKTPHGEIPHYRYQLIGCADVFTQTADSCQHEFYPAFKNTPLFLSEYRSLTHLPKGINYCFDNQVDKTEETHKVLLLCSDPDTDHHEGTGQSIVYMVCMYIGSLFHLATSTVYVVTWPHQNIHGKTLCFCTIALFFMHVFMGTTHLLGLVGVTRGAMECILQAIGAHYFYLAAFTWLLVVNIDLWWTFSSVRHDKGKGSKRFLAYSGLGWGFPALIVIISIIIDNTATCRTSKIASPEYGEHYCFVAPWSQGYYVYSILAVMLVLSVGFACATLFSLYKFKRDAKSLRSTKKDNDKETALLFLKLGIVMGFTWVFEVISWAATRDGENHVVWIALDLYNIMSAVFIFIIFVCKKTTLEHLEQVHPVFKSLTAAVVQVRNAFTSSESSSGSVVTASTGLVSKLSNKSKSGSEQERSNHSSGETAEAVNKEAEGYQTQEL